jgi:4-amino-4-deoxy-L-arabinose transferase-like glycosyltransferase
MDLARRLAAPLALLGLAILYLGTLGQPSLWLDEAWEANYYVGAEVAPWYNRPVLYMSAEKLVVRALGPTEFALRLLPCLAGLAAVAATFLLVRREAGQSQAWGAAALLAIGPPFLFHAHVVKNYTLDAFFAVLLVLLWMRWREARTPARLAWFALAAVLSFGFSFTGAFVVAACAIGEAWAERRTPRRLLPFGGVALAPAAAFAAVFLTFHLGGVGDRLLQQYFAEHYPPMSAVHFPGWLARRTLDVLRAETGSASSLAAGALVAAGLWVRARGGGGPLAWMLPVLLVLHLGAACLRVYPYGVDRLSLDLAPFACAASAGALATLLPRAGPGRLAGVVALAGVAWVLFQPSLDHAGPYLTTGFRQEHIRPLVATLHQRREAEEAIFVTDDGAPAFAFYWWRHGKDLRADAKIVIGERHRLRPEEHRPQVQALAARHARLWCLYSHLPARELATLRALFAEHYEVRERYGSKDVGLDRLVRRAATP